MVLPLLEHGLPRWPHRAVLDLSDAAIDRDLGQLLCGGGGERYAGLKVALECIDLKVRLALWCTDVVDRAASFRVLVECRVGVGRVNGNLLGGGVGCCCGHCRGVG